MPTWIQQMVDQMWIDHERASIRAEQRWGQVPDLELPAEQSVAIRVAVS